MRGSICEPGAGRAGPACDAGEVAVPTALEDGAVGMIGAGMPLSGGRSPVGNGASGATGYKDVIYGMPRQYHGKASTTRWFLKRNNQTHSELCSYDHAGRPTPS